MSSPHIPINEEYYTKVEQALSATKSLSKLQNIVVEAPFVDRTVTTMLGLGIVVLLMVDKQKQTINRIAVSKNDMTHGTFAMTPKPFHEIKIPLNSRENYIAIAIRSRHYMITSDWNYLFTPELSPEEARFNQAGGGIACSSVYPLNIPGGGALIFSYYEHLESISAEHHKFMSKYSELASKYLNSIS